MVPQQPQRQFQRRIPYFTFGKIIPITIFIAVILLIFSEDKSDIFSASSSSSRKIIGKRRSTYYVLNGTDPRDTVMDGGDCAALGEIRRPKWYKRVMMRQSIPLFLKIYRRKPSNSHVKFDHSFAIWFMLKSIEPTPSVIIESGSGQYRWLIRQTLRKTRIITINTSRAPPSTKIYENTITLTGKDFSEIDWYSNELHIDVATAVVFFHDHQSAYKRIFEQAIPRGFKRFILDHNYDYPTGDHLSMKWLCEVNDKDTWPGSITDDFGSVHRNQTWDDHLKQSHEIREKVNTYYEFPPVAISSITGQTKFQPYRTSSPLISDPKLFNRYLGKFSKDEFYHYKHICYVESK